MAYDETALLTAFPVLMERNDEKSREAWGDICRKGERLSCL
jgi:hypothetical protein